MMRNDTRGRGTCQGAESTGFWCKVVYRLLQGAILLPGALFCHLTTNFWTAISVGKINTDSCVVPLGIVQILANSKAAIDVPGC